MTTIDQIRAGVLRAVVRAEKLHPYIEGYDFREEVTGPLVDQMFMPGEIVTKRIADGTVLSFAYSSKIARDFVMAHQDVPDHVWEPQCTRLISHLAHDAQHILIGGAYFGDHAVPLARQTGATIHCFEMNAANAALLTQNAERNGVDNLAVNTDGLWSEPGIGLAFELGVDSHVGARPDRNATAKSESIDNYAERHRIDRLDLIVLDIEGGEHAALKGAEGFLKSSHAPSLIYEVHRSYVDWSRGLENTEIVRYLADFGYTSFALRDYNTNYSMAGRLIELVPLDDIYLDGPPHGFNMIAVKDRAVLERAGVRLVPGVSPKLLFHRNPKIHSPQY